MTDRVSRRIVFQGLGAVGVAAVLAGCGGSSDVAPPAGFTAGSELAGTGDIPVGGGVVLTDVGVVITQPARGEFKAWSARCPHQGSQVTRVEAGQVVCDNHGSHFAISDGSVEAGPATQSLTAVPIKVEGTKILAA